MADNSAIPIIKLWDTLLVPLQGDIGDEQISQLRVDILARIERDNPKGLVIEVSGLEFLDSYLCGVIASIAAAAKLMGVRSVVAGLSPIIAITLETMGVGFGEIQTALSLEDALPTLGITGVSTTKNNGGRR